MRSGRPAGVKGPEAVDGVNRRSHHPGVAALNKDATILEVLARLEEELGQGGFQVVDHWDADSRAVGVASPDDPGRLVYVSASGGSPDRSFYECETPRAGASGDDFPYDVAESADDVDIERLVAAVKHHLGRA